MKPIRVFFRSIRDAIKSVFRNFSLSLASLSCITITLLLVSITILFTCNVNNFTKHIEEDLTIIVMMNKNSDQTKVDELKKDLESLPNIESITFKSNEEIKKEMMIESDKFREIMEKWTVESNPLQHTYLIKVTDINLIGETSNTIKNLDNVAIVKYGEEMVEELVSIFAMIKTVTMIIVAALIVITAFLISNTIKLTIFSRKTEIEIMRLVGTSNVVIKLPFIFEGLILGIIGSIIPVVVTIYGYVISYTNLGGKIFTDIMKLIEPGIFIYQVAACLVIIGGLVGMIGSYRAVRKYLKI